MGGSTRTRPPSSRATAGRSSTSSASSCGSPSWSAAPSTLARAELRELRVQEHGGRRTFISTNAGYRLELHPPREWLDDFLEGQSELTLAELQLRADDPELKASVLGELLEAPYTADSVTVGSTLVRFLPDGPQGRPQLHAELFV